MTKSQAAPRHETPPPAESADPFAGLVRGRIVHYWPHPHEARGAADSGPWPAMVTNVEDDKGTCTLNVNLPKPSPVGEDPVRRMVMVPHRGGPEVLAGGWTWMFSGQGTRYRSDPPSALPEMKG